MPQGFLQSYLIDEQSVMGTGTLLDYFQVLILYTSSPLHLVDTLSY